MGLGERQRSAALAEQPLTASLGAKQARLLVALHLLADPRPATARVGHARAAALSTLRR